MCGYFTGIKYGYRCTNQCYGYFVWIVFFVVVNALFELEEHASPSTDCTKSTRDAFNSRAAINGSTCSFQSIGCCKQLACDGKLFDGIPVEYPDISDPICSLNLTSNITCVDISGQHLNLRPFLHSEHKPEFKLQVYLMVVNTLEHVECIDRRWITWAISGSSALVAVLLTLIISTIVYRNRWKLRYVYYSRKRRYVQAGFDRLFSNDAMISYSKGKATFIKSSVVPSLEHTRDLSLWIHDRDSAAGESVAENITHAICTSRTTVLFIDNEYLTDSWCGYDMNIALVESVETQRKLIIVVLMEGLNADRLSIEVLRLLRNERSLEYPESENDNDLEAFWNELAMEIRN
ncbi:TLR4-like protein [Mya arenaria]|uniref:TLR4-like protein n=1 Tax=Mya arenaria TaxID=6604 RepID=A0ABY7DCQ2_MYAAR|nr:TLR4-like protein [Mya arenaria]